jgi:hypothetical protein
MYLRTPLIARAAPHTSHHGVGENRTHRVGQARQAVAARDKDILDTTIAQVRQDFLPELRPLGVLYPAAQGMLAAVHVDTNGQVGRLGGDHPVVLDPNPDTAHIKDRVHLIKRPGLPRLDLIDHHIGDIRDQLPRRVHPIHFTQMRLDITRRHPT